MWKMCKNCVDNPKKECKSEKPLGGGFMDGRSVRVVLSLLLIILSIALSDGFKIQDKHKGKNHLVTNPEWNRRRSKNSECRLGGVRYALNSTWSPDLGPPFGVWNCVKCSCTPVQKKRRIVARVICRNVKKECSEKPQCENPVLLPGACCKACPVLDHHSNSVSDYIKEEEVNIDSIAHKDFAVLLNGRTSLSPLTTKRVATGRVFLRRGTLHFSFVVDSSTSSSTQFTVQFLSGNGDILEEIETQPTPYEVNNGRICGTWTRVPRQYRNLLMKEQMWVSLTGKEIKSEGVNERKIEKEGNKGMREATKEEVKEEKKEEEKEKEEEEEEDEAISGRIQRYKGVDTEVFSSLLYPVETEQRELLSNQTLLPSGGTAIISVSAPSDSLHISLVFNGIFRASDERNTSIVVELRPSRNLDPVKDTVVLEKIFSDINEAEILTTLGKTSLRLLTRGKVMLRIWSLSAPEMAIEGLITSRATCNVFHTVLTTDFKVLENQIEKPEVKFRAGWGLLFLSNEGDFEYQIRLQGVDLSLVTEISLQTTTKRKIRQVEDVTGGLSQSWINGTYEKPTYRDLDALLREKLEVNVLFSDGVSLKGLFESVTVTEALRTLHPTLLTAPDSWMAATAWAAVDADCVMHYDIRVAGVDPAGGSDPTWNLQLRENDTLWDPRHDQKNITLEETVSGREVAAHTTLLTKVSLSRLNYGVTFLDLSISTSKKYFEPSIMISGTLDQVKVPSFCLFDYQGVPGAKAPESGVQVDAPCRSFGCLNEEAKPIVSKKCIDDEKKVYEDGTTWKSPLDDCARCMCTLGTIKCENEPCPKSSCSNVIQLPGQCCPSCPVVRGQMSERVCEMDGDFHNIGAFWHPFLAPNGFDRCVTCYCNITWNGLPRVDCNRVACPSLNCRESEATYVDKSCCPQCPPTTPAPGRAPTSKLKGMVNEGVTGVIRVVDQRMRHQILLNGGCLERKKILHPNGDVWFPKISPNGVQLCVSCTCKDGAISCVGTSCPNRPCLKGRSCKRKKDKYYYKSKKNFRKYGKITKKRKGRRRVKKGRFG